jgi:putrescine aminotransferase
LLFELRAVRISPPLTISKEEIEKACEMILEAIAHYKG